MARTQAKLSTCMIVQQLETQYFKGWSKDELQAITSKDINAIMEVIAKRFLLSNIAVEEMHGIIHNRDSKEVWDSDTKQYVIDVKPSHFHIVCKFLKEDGVLYAGTLQQIASAVGVEQQYIEKAQKGKYAYDNMLSYLTHIKYADKAQYSPDEVATFHAMKNGVKLGKEYADIYAERKKEWEQARATIKKQQAETSIDSLEEMILQGEVTMEQVLLTDRYFTIYARNKRRCDDAFDTYTQRKIAKTMQAMENGEFKVSVIFVTGHSHSGKSVFTDHLAKKIKQQAKDDLGEDWSIGTCAATNPFDEYHGEEIFIMDDVRGMSLCASDWLKLLDPDRINVGSARYRNKKMACRAIIINSEKDVCEFFYYVKGSGGDRSEAMDQFFRRIMARVVVYRVPDSEERQISIGTMQETSEYLVDAPTNNPAFPDTLKLHHGFISDGETLKMNYDEAINYLAEMVKENNSLHRERRNQDE